MGRLGYELRVQSSNRSADIATLLRSGRLETAAGQCASLDASSPNTSALWEQIADGFDARGDTLQAVRALGEALKGAETSPALRTKYAVALIQGGQTEAAKTQLLKTVDAHPRFAPAQMNLGTLCAEQGDFLAARQHLMQATLLAPDYVEAFVNLAKVLQQRNETEALIGCLRRLAALQPGSLEVLFRLAQALGRMSRFAEAATLWRHLQRLQPQNADVFLGLGEALHALGQLQDAQHAYAQGLSLSPNSPGLHCSMGSVYRTQGRLEEALAEYELALMFEPNSVRARWNRSLALLHLGDYARGWQDYDIRLTEPHALRFTPSKPRPIWDGSPLNGRTLLIHPEQGLGDVIQFIRYVPLIKERFKAGKILVMVPPPLLKIIATCAGIDELLPESPTLPEDRYDAHIPLLSLPHRFGTTLATLPNTPYLHAEPDRIAHWNARLTDLGAPDTCFRIGIVWQGNPHNAVDRFRSIPLHEFEPLTQIPGTKLISLQHLFGLDQLTTTAKHLPILNPTPNAKDSPDDFADTAALIANCDLIVSSCTSVPHLAGALGKKTFLALAANGDWRWLTKRTDSPWYPSMRLFRQQDLGQWKPVFADIGSAVVALVASRHP